MPTILLADDHPITVMGTRSFVESLGYTVVDTCSNGIAAYNGILARCPDLALVDMNMPGLNGIELLEKLGRQKCTTKVVLLTMHNEAAIFNRAMALGARGYVLKEFALTELTGCLAEVSRGGICYSPHFSSYAPESDPAAHETGFSALTFSEKKIVELIAGGHSSRAIAQMLFISEKTVENHRSNIIRKLALPAEKNALLVWAMQHQKAQA
ncbi:MAG: response regulator transcription factor [Sphingobacteriales bacterium]|nr:MAG: response regulator transcription factor [Sphingobacteriales bacterium]